MDIVERLRDHQNGGRRNECEEAADEIERLRAALAEIADGVDTWTAEGMAHLAREALGPNGPGELPASGGSTRPGC